MDEIPFYRKPGFWVGFWIVTLIGIYIYQVLTQRTVFSVLAVIFSAGLLVGLFSFWMAFYAQFILPVRKLEDRSKIVQRLKHYLSRTHGPALFIQNGRVLAREGELERKQAGVIWVDTASAAVTRTATAYKQVLGPGIHFTSGGEYLAGWLDLHTQVQTVGPREGDLTFQKLPEEADEETKNKYRQFEERRTSVSALTRDGIEVVPNITVVFRIDAQPAGEGEAGSHFGYDENAVFKAISMEGINPSAKADGRHVAWNQIPALIAADLWREYASKFTLSQLFEPSQPSLPRIPQPQPAPPELPPPPPLPGRAGMVTRMLRVINSSLEKRVQQYESREQKETPARGASVSAASVSPVKEDAHPRTALQTIAEMVKARMTQALVPLLDESGRLADGYARSEEYKKVQERGLKILSVSISNPRVPPAVEEHTVKDWNANWLVNANAERRRIQRRIESAVDEAKQKALLDYALDLGRSLLKEKPADVDSMLLTLLERSRNQIIRDDRLRNLMAAEISKAKQKAQPVDLTPAILSLIDQSKKEARTEVPDNGVPPRGEDYLDFLEKMIKRTETHDL